MRRLGFAVLTGSMAVAACGRIVTVPKVGAGTGVPAGNMFIRFRVLGTLDFVGQRYIVVFNTSGNGQTPLATSINSFANYSFELIFGGTNVGGASYQLLQVVPTGNSAGYQQIQVPIQTQFVTNFNPNSNGTGNEFTFTFNRSLLTPIATPSPTAAPTAGATASPAPGVVSTLWNLNFFSTDSQGNPIDAISNNGVQDVTFNAPVTTTAQSDQVFNKPSPPPIQVPNANTQVMAIEIINTP
jgi:hypothetical protein